MAVARGKKGIPAWGRGRKDYSARVEFSTVPFITSHQYRFVSSIRFENIPTWYIPPEEWSWVYLVPYQYLNKTWVVNLWRFEIDSDVLVEIAPAKLDRSGNVLEGPYAYKYGYGCVEVKASKGIPFSPQSLDECAGYLFRHFGYDLDTISFAAKVIGFLDVVKE